MSISICLFFEKHYFLCFTITKPTDAWEDWARQQFSFRFCLNPEPQRVLSSVPSDGSNLLSFCHPFFKPCFFFLFPTWLLRNWPHICPLFLSVSMIFWPLLSPSLLPHDWSLSSGFSLLFLYHMIYLYHIFKGTWWECCRTPGIPALRHLR